MTKFENLTKYIDMFNDDDFGTWIIDQENDGAPEHPLQMPFVNYSILVHQFIDDVYAFEKSNAHFGLNHYVEILNRNDIEWGIDSMNNADVSSLDAQCIMALIMGAVRSERFCDGALLGFFKDGSICRWLERLKEIDEGAN